MASEELLQALGRHEREALADEDLLERAVRGELSELQRLELTARASTDPELAARWELYRPLDEAEQQRLVASVRTDRRPKRRFSGWARLAAPIAAVLGLLLAALWLKPPARALEEYTLQVDRLPTVSRGPAPEPSDTLHIDPQVAPLFLLRPAHSSSGSRDARVFVRASSPSAGGELPSWTAWPSQIERAASGSIRVTLQGLSQLPATGSLGICVFDGSRAAPTGDSFERDAGCRRFVRGFALLEPAGKATPTPRQVEH